MEFAPIVLFVYRRPEHTLRTLQALRANAGAAQCELFIFADAPKTPEDAGDVAAVREIVQHVEGFRAVTVAESETHLGLARSVIQGVTQVCRHSGRVIVLEDDLVSAPAFLTYMNNALAFYESFSRVFSISGYNLSPTHFTLPPDYAADVFFNYRPMSWGWATWWSRWQAADWSVADYGDFLANPRWQQLFNRGGHDLTTMLRHQMEGRIDSWYIRWCYTHCRQGAVSLYPVYSYIDNIGHDGSGTHSPQAITRFRADLALSKAAVTFPLPVEVEEAVMARFVQAWSPPPAPTGVRARVRQRLGRLLGRTARGS